MWTHSAHTGAVELTVIDWAMPGPGAVGNDLGQMIGSALYQFNYDPADAAALEMAVVESYLAWIAAAGRVIDPRLVRLGYLIALSFWKTATLPVYIKFHLSDKSEASVQAVFAAWQLKNACALSSINARLSTVKVYAKLAALAGALDPGAQALIRNVAGYAHKEEKHVNEKRTAVALTLEQARQLKDQPGPPPQGGGGKK